MRSNLKFFKKKSLLPVEKFVDNVLYDKKIGYYSKKKPFGKNGDFITAPNISNLFSEMIAVWIISTWKIFGKPKKFNVVELGPGDGSLTKILLKTFKNFPEFDSIKKIYLYEISNNLKILQKKQIHSNKVKWINNFKSVSGGPVIFFGNEFFDAIPIQQFKKYKGKLYKKYYRLRKDNKIDEIFKLSNNQEKSEVLSYKTLRDLKFIEFPKKGFFELRQIIKKISTLKGCLLMIDYGYLKSKNLNTLQSVKKHKKNNLLNNLGEADITSHVNFSLLEEFFLKNNLEVKGITSQQKFLKKMGIIDRAEILSKNMKFKDQTNLYLRLRRLLSPKLMGEMFKVILAYKFKSDNFFGFE